MFLSRKPSTSVSKLSIKATYLHLHFYEKTFVEFMEISRVDFCINEVMNKLRDPHLVQVLPINLLDISKRGSSLTLINTYVLSLLIVETSVIIFSFFSTPFIPLYGSQWRKNAMFFFFLLWLLWLRKMKLNLLLWFTERHCTDQYFR